MTISVSPNNEIQNICDKLYLACKENDVQTVRSILPSIHNTSVINEIHTASGSTCLHVSCFYGREEIVELLLQNGASCSIPNKRFNLTPFEEACTEKIRKLFLVYKAASSTNSDYHYIEWSMTGDDLLRKRRDFREMIDLYKTYDNRHLISKLLTEVIHYYLNDYLTNEMNKHEHSQREVFHKQIETIRAYFEEAIEKQDYLTYFIKAYTMTTCFYQELNKHLALYVLDYFDDTNTQSKNYRLVNCLVHIVTLLIYHPKLPKYEFHGICYRGMRITQLDLNQYKLNQHILNLSFLSASTDSKVAEMFAGEGQQCHMRHTYQDRHPLQYSCVCRYLVKQYSTAINVETFSSRPDEKEVLIIPFSVFKVVNIKKNEDDSKDQISVEIELEECIDEISDPIRGIQISTDSDQIKDVEEYESFKKRKYFLYSINVLLVLAFAIAISVTLVVTLVNRGNAATTVVETDSISHDDFEYPVEEGCPHILNRFSWNARPFINRDYIKPLPVAYVVIRQVATLISMRHQEICIRKMQEIQNDEIDRLGWFDIGYNFIICSDDNGEKRIYKGRGWKFIGAYCKGYNARSLVKI